ncbi:MAG TPA: KH domain-containing protein [Anaerolineaceae bacterium]|nr:KH domain-containing protein [Anaerolineaceae bacterium]
MKQDELLNLLEYMTKSLVDKPEEVSVEQYQDGKTLHLDLQVNPEDIGRVIGKHGRVANAMRTLLRMVAARNGQQVMMDIVDVE